MEAARAFEGSGVKGLQPRITPFEHERGEHHGEVSTQAAASIAKAGERNLQPKVFRLEPVAAKDDAGRDGEIRVVLDVVGT